jgi:hypothetical protein
MFSWHHDNVVHKYVQLLITTKVGTEHYVGRMFNKMVNYYYLLLLN